MASKLCRHITIAVSGSIGVIDTMKFIMHLRRFRFVEEIKVLMTRSSQQFVTPVAMRAYGGSEVVTDLFDPMGYAVPHLASADETELFMVMPASANILGKVAHGIADDLVTTCCISTLAPMMFVPSMNERMWYNRFVAHNIALLREAGHVVLTPSMGVEVSTMTNSFGAIPDFETILEEMFRAIGKLV